MKYETKDTGRKCVFERVPYTPIQRIRLWAGTVLDAIKTAPPKEYTTTKEITPDDPRWNQPFTMSIMRDTVSWDSQHNAKHIRPEPEANQ